MYEQLIQQFNQLLKNMETNIRNSKQLTDVNYKEICITTCRRAPEEMYQIQADLIKETKRAVEKALSLSEDDTMTRRQLFQIWQMVFDSSQERCKQIENSVQTLLENTDQYGTESKKRYSPLLNSGCAGFVLFLCLIVLNPLSLSVCTSVAVYSAGALSATFILHTLKQILSKNSQTASTDGSTLVKKLDMKEFNQNVNDLLQTLKIEESVWYSNEALRTILAYLKQQETSLNLLKYASSLCNAQLTM